MKELEIKGKNIKLTKIHAEEGYRLLHKLGRVLGPSLGKLAEDKIGDAINLFFQNLSEDDLVRLVNQLAPKIIVDGKNLDKSDYGLTMACIKELLIYNFEDFFSPVADALKDFGVQQVGV